MRDFLNNQITITNNQILIIKHQNDLKFKNWIFFLVSGLVRR
jgi:hypothetical protein